MFIYFGIFSIFFIPYTNAILAASLHDPASKNVDVSSNLQEQNNTKLFIASEGGFQLSNISVVLPKETHPITTILDKELVKTKEQSVVPRKGVKYDLKEIISNEHVSVLNDNINILKNKTELSNISNSIKQNVFSGEQFNKTKLHKPTVLSSKLLDELGEKIEIKPDAKVQKANENSHPDLIMPIVITILVVPMFAVVGYMVIKRGQEAWKNRHYKRMDFLLDGMYND